MIAALLLRIKGYAAAAIGAVLFLTFVYVRARQDGKNVVELENARRSAEALTKKKEVDDEVDRIGAARRSSELKRWMRDR